MSSADRAACKAAALRDRLAAATDPNTRFKLAVKLAKYEARVKAAAPPPPAPTRPPPTLHRVTPADASTIAPPPLTAAELARRAARAARFEAGSERPAQAAPTLHAAARAAGRDHALGASTALEKEYLRLTTLPTVDNVRPPRVLADALAHVKARWREGVAYTWACPQLKSIRQDVTVQGVRDALAVDAYETHARVALEAGDLAEFNQCATALVVLHSEARARGAAAARNAPEFAAYRILYAAVVNAGLAGALRSVEPRDRASLPVSHALRVVAAARAGDAAALAAAYDDAPRMAPYLMDKLVPSTRCAAAGRIVSAFRPALPLTTAARWLGLGREDLELAAAVLREAGADVTDGTVVTRREEAPEARGKRRSDPTAAADTRRKKKHRR